MHRILLTCDSKDRRSLYKILAAIGCEVVVTEQLPELAALADCSLLILDYDTVRAEVPDFLRAVGELEKRPPVLLLTASRDKADLMTLLSQDVFTNLIAKNTDLQASELMVTVQKLLLGDIEGFEKYLTWGVQPRSVRVESSTAKNGILDELEQYLGAVGVNGRLTSMVRSVGDEFLTNAIYNAPADSDGTPKYASRSRIDAVDLAAGEDVLFRYACDGRQFALSVRDNFGRLDRDTVTTYLHKCFLRGIDQIDDKDGGAGLGLYYIFESLNQFIINVKPGVYTEMIGIMDVSGTYRDFAEKPKSLNIFVGS